MCSQGYDFETCEGKPMEFSVHEKDDVVILVIDGEMVGGPDATVLADKIRDLIEEGKNRIVVDMEKVNFMNSSGLGILIGSLTTVRNNGGDLRLFHLSNKLREVLRITKLHSVFEVFEDEGKAIGSFS